MDDAALMTTNTLRPRGSNTPAEVQLGQRDAKLYNKLYVSSIDIEFAQYCAEVLLKKGWHAKPWERRGTIYKQQSAFTSALVTAYARLFTRSKGRPKLPSKLITCSGPEAALHKHLLDLRHTVFAHSDSARYSIRPWRSGDFATNIVSAPVLRLTAEEATLFLAMSSKLLTAVKLRMDALLASVPN